MTIPDILHRPCGLHRMPGIAVFIHSCMSGGLTSSNSRVSIIICPGARFRRFSPVSSSSFYLVKQFLSRPRQHRGHGDGTDSHYGGNLFGGFVFHLSEMQHGVFLGRQFVELRLQPSVVFRRLGQRVGLTITAVWGGCHIEGYRLVPSQHVNRQMPGYCSGHRRGRRFAIYLLSDGP